MTMNMPKATYIREEYVKLDGLASDGYISLTIEAAKSLHSQLSAILYGAQEEPAQVS